ncbi:epidermis-specific secreted glycoprotein EP1-like [Hibiscus syriacus]|uniref:Epidermis-specific secreted glycoprotein EP1-like n=1 Tax=Hibiscus syriacus TaxID=106335 RepID=A0A6A2YWE7_HIBSY|nr:epidermis-specific secreted glycoprotein EP1-like [Hibiscus syriacus]
MVVPVGLGGEPGKPVRENTTFSRGTDGNLVLADADGRVAWQSNTANKGVVGFKLLPNGNMVLHDASGKFIWQNFDHPTDTLLVSQSIRADGATKLVSRALPRNNVDGAYSLVMEPKELVLQYKGPNTPKPLVYFRSSVWPNTQDGTLQTVTLNVEETNDGFAYNVLLDYTVANSSIGTGNIILTRPKYNSILSFLRLGIDGNLRVFTYYERYIHKHGKRHSLSFPGTQYGAQNQCVACPSPNGLLGWSRNCQAQKVSCSPNTFSYYKVDGVDHFMRQYNEGQGIKESDCKCLGYFYPRMQK